jgi:Replication protein
MIAHFAHVMLCGRVWVCPVCGPKIRQKRATELDLACARWIEGHGVASLLLLTLTLPHDFGEPLGDLLKTVRDSFTSLVSGRAWQSDKQRFGLAHWVRAHDITVGKNGWHPHLHIVLFARAPLSANQCTALEDSLYSRWVRVVTNRGFRPPSRQYGIQLEQARSRADAARYVCQVVAGEDDRAIPVAMEVARGDLKTSLYAGQRTPWQVLADFASTGDCADLSLWREWENATERVQAIRWSCGLRNEIALGEEATDDEVVQAVVGGEVVYTFAMPEWRLLCRTRGARAKALQRGEEGGEIGVHCFMQELVKASEPNSSDTNAA